MRVLKIMLILGFSLLGAACKHPLAIEGDGDIINLTSSDFGCTLEQFQADDIACTGADIQGDYFVDYSAVPRPGWRFVRWEGPCGHLSQPPNCRIETPAAWIQFWDANFAEVDIPATTAIFEPINSSPVANAGVDQEVVPGTVVSLAGSGTDPEGDTLSFVWSQQSGSNVALNNATQATAVFTAPDVSNTSQLSFRLTVTDDGGLTGQDDVIITVVNDDAAIVDLYNATCAGCHRSGTFGAPRALTSDWDVLVPSGINALVNSVEQGLGFMPAGGRCGSCSRDDFAALISYMADTTFP